ncbi:hypothetical protein F5J12DRAFT_930755 [Pisolithus orientalis]|uniref:uncharacterized protein n=1 Tax=Pisolithus orientalis TaxID=936130 RepID=UPI00222561B6|nr:uncharacterized protein F5J12DRAFT_930755 [Pisolithus orientalis]KAI5982793.1 hypothetical protein F5J12DRAFT_930755 [Pisolithus orientalis]
MSFNFSNIGNSPSTQSSSHSFATPSTTPHFPPAQNNPNIDPTLLDEDVIPAHFIDALTNQFSFGDSKQDLQCNLHGFAKAAIFSLIKENWAMTNMHHNTQQLLTDLQIQLENTFTLSHKQKANVCIVAGDIIFEASQITFMTIHFDIESVQWYKISGPTLGLTPACTAQLAILLLDHEEDVEDDSPPTEDDSGSWHHSAQEPQRKKQKCGGHVPRGEDFWSQVEKWFDAHRKQWGDSWTTPNWNSYISETIAKDEDHYKVHVIHNPFMEDVHTDDRFFTGPITSAGLGAAEDLLQEMV